jgi:hypothetical protein
VLCIYLYYLQHSRFVYTSIDTNMSNAMHHDVYDG